MAQFDLRRLFRIPTPSERLGGLGLRTDLARAAVRMVSDERSDVEVKQLEGALLETEAVIMLVEGKLRRQLGLLALTSQRILFRAHGSAADRMVVVPLAAVSGVDSGTRSMTGTVVVRTEDSIVEVDKILGTQATQFADAVRHQLIDPGPLPVQDPVQELLDLRARREAGSISEADFQAAKLRLLDEL